MNEGGTDLRVEEREKDWRTRVSVQHVRDIFRACRLLGQFDDTFSLLSVRRGPEVPPTGVEVTGEKHGVKEVEEVGRD